MAATRLAASAADETCACAKNSRTTFSRASKADSPAGRHRVWAFRGCEIAVGQTVHRVLKTYFGACSHETNRWH